MHPATPAHHQPVLLEEVLHWLAPQPGQTIVDATLGGGGHSQPIAARLGPTGSLIGIDQDREMLARAKVALTERSSAGEGSATPPAPPCEGGELQREEDATGLPANATGAESQSAGEPVQAAETAAPYNSSPLQEGAGGVVASLRNLGKILISPQLHLLHYSFEQLPDALHSLGITQVDGILADLGFASDQMDDPTRGLSFQQEGPLDMRLNRDEGEPASELLAHIDEKELADLIYQYGEERFSRRVARRIVETRRVSPLKTTTQLAELVRRCVPRSGKIDPATRTFQALRIAVNNELGKLEEFLKNLPILLKGGGRAVIISFHSLEDRLVKQAFRQANLWRQLTKKPITATEEEMARNPRARSAKLRAAERLAG